VEEEETTSWACDGLADRPSAPHTRSHPPDSRRHAGAGGSGGARRSWGRSCGRSTSACCSHRSGKRSYPTRPQAANVAKSIFLATMSHELRTPLAAIIGYEELLADAIPGPINTEQREQLARIKRSAAHLLALVDEVLTLSESKPIMK